MRDARGVLTIAFNVTLAVIQIMSDNIPVSHPGKKPSFNERYTRCFNPAAHY